MEPINENELMQRQNSRYGCSFWTNGQHTIQVAKEAGNHYPQIENLKSMGYTIDQTKR